MKKLYILAAAAILTAGSASAKSFTLYMGDGTPITNGSSIEFNEPEIIDLNEYGVEQVDYKYDPGFYVISDEAANFQVTAKSTCDLKIQLCFGGTCESGMELTRTQDIEANKKTMLLFDVMGSVKTIDEVPSASAELEVMYTGDEASKVGFSIDMKRNGIKVVKFDPSFRIGNGVINYDLDGEAVASIYSINGAEVVRANISGEGAISTANLPAGIYVYRLQGSKNIAGKLIVK